MITKEMIDRINFLYRKRTTDGLTAEEEAEQTQLRQEYLAAIRGQVEQTLTRIVQVDGEEEINNGCNCPDGHCHHH